MDYIAEIRELAEKGYSLGVMGEKKSNGQTVLFEPTATMDQIKAFERDLCVTLPIPFVRYLTELGNGGVGADYGIYSLDFMRQRNPYAKLTKNLPPMLDHSLTDKQWEAFAERYTETEEKLFDEKFSSPKKEKQLKKLLNNMELQMIAGGIFISTPGCTMNTILMCRGAAEGEIFVLDWDYMSCVCSEPWCGGKFEDWMINSMRLKIEKASLKDK